MKDYPHAAVWCVYHAFLYGTNKILVLAIAVTNSGGILYTFLGAK